MHIKKIKNRTGEIISFDRTKIESAIAHACNAVYEEDQDFIPELTSKIISDLILEHSDHSLEFIPSVELIQDIVEKNLVDTNKYEVAKAYILYRNKQLTKREEKKEQLIEQFESQSLNVIKNDGSKELFDVQKIKEVFIRASKGYENICLFNDLIETFKKNIIEDIKTSNINKLIIKACIDLVSVENISWQHIAARIALGNIYKQASYNRNIKISDIYSPQPFKDHFDNYIQEGLYYKDFYEYYSDDDILQAGGHINKTRDEEYEYTTILSFNKRYLLNPNGVIKELPQEMYMAVALFLAIPEKKEDRLNFAFEIYDQCSSQKISLPTPTLVNARTNYNQLSSCFKINIDDDLRAIYHGVENMAQISKFGGGCGVYLGNIRAQGSMIRNVEGISGGVTPWIKIINDTAVAVNQQGTRLGAISVTLDMWHHDIYSFLDLQTETGDIRSKAFDIFPAIAIPDIFMRRVENDEDWTLFDPHEITKKYNKKLQDNFGEEFDLFYEQLEKDASIKVKTTIKAKDLFKKFLKTTVETGMPYVFFRDTVNRLNANKHAGNIYSTQLCTEICQNTSPSTFTEETLENDKISITYNAGDLVVCNLASINIAKVHKEEDIKKAIPIVMRLLDNVITLNFYPIKEAENTAIKYRSVGLGYLGLAEYLAVNKIAYDSQQARDEVDRLFERYTYYTYKTSNELAKERGTYKLYKESEYDNGKILGKELDWYQKNTPFSDQWRELFDNMKKYGIRFAYHTAPAPNTSTAGVVGTTAALLPIYKKYFVETNLSAPTIRVAPQLSKENFWFYKEYINMDMNEVIDMISVIYKWIDQSISFEWMIDPSKTTPLQLYEYYLKAWKQGIKTVYYVRSLSGEIKEDCISCSG